MKRKFPLCSMALLLALLFGLAGCAAQEPETPAADEPAQSDAAQTEKPTYTTFASYAYKTLRDLCENDTPILYGRVVGKSDVKVYEREEPVHDWLYEEVQVELIACYRAPGGEQPGDVVIYGEPGGENEEFIYEAPPDTVSAEIGDEVLLYDTNRILWGPMLYIADEDGTIHPNPNELPASYAAVYDDDFRMPLAEFAEVLADTIAAYETTGEAVSVQDVLDGTAEPAAPPEMPEGLSERDQAAWEIYRLLIDACELDPETPFVAADYYQYLD